MEDWLLPARCPVCGGAAAGPLCDPCLAACAAPRGPCCPRCGDGWEGPRPCGRCARFGRAFAFRTAAALWRYEGPARALVHAFKFRGRAEVLEPLGRRMAAMPRATSLLGGADLVVIPAPATRKGRRRRGYDQAQGLAWGVARALRRPCEPAALRRRRAAPSQGRSRSERRRVQLRGALAARAALVEGRAVLLVDDVLSTGATADAAARALRLAGARDVTVLTLAT